MLVGSLQPFSVLQPSVRAQLPYSAAAADWADILLTAAQQLIMKRSQDDTCSAKEQDWITSEEALPTFPDSLATEDHTAAGHPLSEEEAERRWKAEQANMVRMSHVGCQISQHSTLLVCIHTSAAQPPFSQTALMQRWLTTLENLQQLRCNQTQLAVAPMQQL